jgi:hypothetical protein
LPREPTSKENDLMKLLRIASIAVLALTSVACGDDSTDGSSSGGTDVGEGTINPTVAQSTAQATISAVRNAISTNDGQTAAFGLAGMGAGAFAIVAPAAGGAPQSAPDGLGRARQADNSGTCDCDPEGHSCTFDNCGDTAGGSSWSVSGTFSWDGGHAVGDLTFTGAYTGFDWNFHEIFDFTVTETSIDGTFSSDGSYDVTAQGQSVSAEWTSSIGYDQVTFDANGCPTGGSINVEAEITANGQSFSGSGDVTLDGSLCGG